MKIERISYWALFPITFAAIWYESDFFSAISRFAFVIYLVAGLAFTIKILSGALSYFAKSKTMAIVSITYLVAYAVYWLSMFGFDRQAILLVTPFLFGLVIFYTLKVCKWLFYAPRT